MMEGRVPDVEQLARAVAVEAVGGETQAVVVHVGPDGLFAHQLAAGRPERPGRRAAEGAADVLVNAERRPPPAGREVQVAVGVHVRELHARRGGERRRPRIVLVQDAGAVAVELHQAVGVVGHDEVAPAVTVHVAEGELVVFPHRMRFPNRRLAQRAVDVFEQAARLAVARDREVQIAVAVHVAPPDVVGVVVHGRAPGRRPLQLAAPVQVDADGGRAEVAGDGREVGAAVAVHVAQGAAEAVVRLRVFPDGRRGQAAEVVTVELLQHRGREEAGDDDVEVAVAVHVAHVELAVERGVGGAPARGLLPGAAAVVVNGVAVERHVVAVAHDQIQVAVAVQVPRHRAGGEVLVARLPARRRGEGDVGRGGRRKQRGSRKDQRRRDVGFQSHINLPFSPPGVRAPTSPCGNGSWPRASFSPWRTGI